MDWVRIDVTSDESVAAAAAEVRERFGGLDVLVNNAGIAGPIGAVEDYTGADLMAVLDTNTAGIVRTTHAFLPLLRESAAPVIVNVSSGLGSFAARSDESRIEHSVPSLGYSASKVAVNMLTSVYAQFLPELRVNTVDPGVHGHRPERPRRAADRHRGHGRDRRNGDDRGGRPDRHLHRPARRRRLVTPAAVGDR
ncbi:MULTISPECIES: SDR family NAD(P)-dependent oxidoreductase [unclassified Modestobacter]